MIKTALAKLLTLKAAAVVATASVGGVAVAASTGLLPNPIGQDSPASVHSPEGDRPDGAGTPSPSLHGLCTAFQAGAGSAHGKALESPAFTALIDAAGGPDKVDAYCTDLLATRPGSAPSDRPGNAPTTVPTGAPGARPSDLPEHPPAGNMPTMPGKPTPSRPKS
ncbi:MAG TPA: hypothetical protein VF163_20500 [Micromonosporaceae bacterium]